MHKDQIAAASLQCGVDVLDALASDDALAEPGITTSRLAELTGRDRGLVTRVVADLLVMGFVERYEGTRRLRLGWRLYASAELVAQQRLAEHSQPLLDRLAEQTGESSYVCVRRGAEAVTVAEASPAQAVQVISWVGRSYPLARSDAGPALMSEMTLEDFVGLLGGRSLPATRAVHAPDTLDGLWALVEASRARGVSVLDEQAEEHVGSLAAPVWDFRGRVAAAVVVSGPTVRMRGRFDVLAELVAAAARELSDHIGARR